MLHSPVLLPVTLFFPFLCTHVAPAFIAFIAVATLLLSLWSHSDFTLLLLELLYPRILLRHRSFGSVTNIVFRLHFLASSDPVIVSRTAFIIHVYAPFAVLVPDLYLRPLFRLIAFHPALFMYSKADEASLLILAPHISSYTTITNSKYFGYQEGL